MTIYKNYGKNQISNGRGAGFNSMWIGKGIVQQKGETAEVGSRGSDRFPLGRQRTSAGLSQKFFVKRYQWLFGTARPGAAVPHIP